MRSTLLVLLSGVLQTSNALQVQHAGPLPNFFTKTEIAVDIHNEESHTTSTELTGCGGMSPAKLVKSISAGDTLRFAFTLQHGTSLDCTGFVNGVAIRIQGQSVHTPVVPTTQPTAKPVVLSSFPVAGNSTLAVQCKAHPLHVLCRPPPPPTLNPTVASTESPSPSVFVSLSSVVGVVDASRVPSCPPVGRWDAALQVCLNCRNPSCALPSCGCSTDVFVSCSNGVFSHEHQACVCSPGWHSSVDAHLRLSFCDIQDAQYAAVSERYGDGGTEWGASYTAAVVFLILVVLLLLVVMPVFLLCKRANKAHDLVLWAALVAGVVTEPTYLALSPCFCSSVDSALLFDELFRQVASLPIPPPWFLADICTPPVSPFARTEPIYVSSPSRSRSPSPAFA
eukprot:TRINITY_DN3353_c0_g1_i1.p1 TRINITY_DN3353_c0_g1~~TRINITY_DN3353_c0_g1_i1.p1  ORF type:complete len:417 (+),score=64.70 TRINITY_DN3353_c0_g1_i1:68-1252(+)